MDEVPGSLGTTASFSLRMGQTMFSSASLLFMSFGVEFYSYTAFCYLVTIMGLVIPWSFTLALVDGYSILLKCPIRQPGILLIIVVGDWVLSTLTLAAASSTASVVDLLLNTHGSFCPPKLCSRWHTAVLLFGNSLPRTGVEHLSCISPSTLAPESSGGLVENLR
ncbi:CASP-like protein [Vigna angularis]|uniref:CASP-like protein n=1 Tax=Phaseolus angularis TaxID=3914 RepID=A0A8T0KDC6_PHAAN|nr:CASP-like protein [Vigna angularis]